MKKIILMTCITLTGCTKSMTYEEVLKAEKYCTDRGLTAITYRHGFAIDPKSITAMGCTDGTYNFPNPEGRTK